jgi:hypothetical protein
MYKTLIQLLFLHIIAALILSCAKTEARESNNINADGGEKAVIVGSNVNVRERPSVDAKVVVQLQSGNMVTIIEKDPDEATIAGKTNHWYKVSGEFGSGWVFGAFLDLNANPGTEPTSKNLILDEASICYEIGNIYECKVAVEKEWIRHYPELIKRIDKTLSIKLGTGNWKNYLDKRSQPIGEYDEKASLYTLSRFYADPGIYYIDHHVIDNSYGRVILKSTGVENEVANQPILSNSKKKFACFRSVIEDGEYDGVTFEIWKIDQSGFKIELQLKDPTTPSGQPWGIQNVTWVSDSQIVLSKVVRNETNYELVDAGTVNFQQVNGKWQEVK